MKELRVNDLKVAYRDEGPTQTSDGGIGKTVLLAHCSNASSKEWTALSSILVEQGYRVLVPDFTGYGRSDPWPDNRPFDPDADINILRKLLDLVDGPVHMVGHSYGGAMTLETARYESDRLLSLTLIEPIIFQLLHETDHKQWPVVSRLGRKVMQAVERGDSRKAAYLFTSFWIGQLKWFFLPERNKRAISKSMKKVMREFEIVDLAHRTPEHYSGINVPVQLILGTRTRAPAKAVAQILKKVLPSVELTLIRAGHMSPYTHSNKINQLILKHIQQI